MKDGTIPNPNTIHPINGYDKEIAFSIAQDSISSFEGTNLKKVFLVVYGDLITSFLSENGYKVIEIPEDLKKNQKKNERNQKAEQIHKIHPENFQENCHMNY